MTFPPGHDDAQRILQCLSVDKDAVLEVAYHQLVQFVREHPQVPLMDDRGMSALHIASKSNKTELITACLLFPADINTICEGHLPLQLYIQSTANHTGITGIPLAFEQYLAAGADINAWDGRDETPLHLALQVPAHIGDLTAVHRMLAHGALPDHTSPNKLRRTPLMCAAEHDRVSCAQAILAAGADVNRTTDGAALHFAHSPAMIDLLIAHGAQTEVRNNHGKTPLQNALDESRDNTDLRIGALLQAGCSVHALDWTDIYCIDNFISAWGSLANRLPLDQQTDILAQLLCANGTLGSWAAGELVRHAQPTQEASHQNGCHET